jgi:glycerol-3-phosphate dehydrogenase
VVEGVPTLESVLDRTRGLGLDLPIMSAVGEVFLEGRDPRRVIHDLMTRPSGPE